MQGAEEITMDMQRDKRKKNKNTNSRQLIKTHVYASVYVMHTGDVRA